MVEPPQTHSKLPCSPSSPAGKWFEGVWCGRTTTYSLEPAQQACFPVHESGSKRFGVVEPLQAYSNLPCRPASPFVTVVLGGSVWLNRHKLTRICPVGLLLHSSHRFEVVQGDSVQSNLPELTRNCPSGLRYIMYTSIVSALLYYLGSLAWVGGH